MDFDGKVLLEETSAWMWRRSRARSISIGRSRSSPTRAPGHFARVRRRRVDGGERRSRRNLAYLAPVKEVHLKPAQLKVETLAQTATTRFA